MPQQVWNKLKTQFESYDTKRPNKKGEISNFNDVNGSKFKISPFLSGQNSLFLLSQYFCKRSSLRSQTFLSFRTLHLTYPKLVGTPCILIPGFALQKTDSLQINRKCYQIVAFP